MKKLDRKSKIISLFEDQVILAQRDAYDVMMMVNFSMQNQKHLTPEMFLYQYAKVVEAGLKYTYKILPWYSVRKLNLKRKLRVKYLLRHLSQDELINLSNQVYELEGIEVPSSEESKKKVKTEKPPNSTSN